MLRPCYRGFINRRFLMRRILISGLAVLLGAAMLVHVARSEPSKTDTSTLLIFRFLRVDPEQELAILRPMIAPDIGVQLDSGSPKLEQRAILQCHAFTRERDALVEGQIGKITEMVLDCGDRKFVVKAIDFSPQRSSSLCTIGRCHPGRSAR